MATMEGLSIADQLRRFWRWWTGELAMCIPAAIRNGVRRLSVLPMVVMEKGAAGVHRYDGKTWQRIASAQGDTAESLAKALAVQLRTARIDRFAVGLPPGQYLSKTLTIPQAAEENLRNALLYELDRHTPFKSDDVGFDCAIVGRNDASREIIVRLVIAPKATIAGAVSTAATTGLTVATVQPALPDRDSLSINLLPHDDSANRILQRAMRWIPWLVLLALGVAALALPIIQKRAQVIELQPQVNIAAQQAAAADALNQQLDRAQNEYNFLLLKRYAIPTALQLLYEATRILPDDTWLQSFELRTTQKGRELQMQGETGVAGKMIELFEQSPLVAGASFKSPLTQAPGSTASRFHIGMDVKEVPPPAMRSVKPDGAAPTTAGAAPPPPGAAPPPPRPGSPPGAGDPARPPGPPPGPGAPAAGAPPGPPPAGTSPPAPVAGPAAPPPLPGTAPKSGPVKGAPPSPISVAPPNVAPAPPGAPAAAASKVVPSPVPQTLPATSPPVPGKGVAVPTFGSPAAPPTLLPPHPPSSTPVR